MLRKKSKNAMITVESELEWRRKMNLEKILSHVDHTLLAPTATWDQIRALCDDAICYQTASVCIPPSFVKRAKEYVGEKMVVCTVIGFPNGYHTTKAKVYETLCAVEDGADEIDMVINLGFAKSGDFEAVEEEILQVRAACPGKILKVIVETCLLTREEKVKMCEIVGRAGADYIKTSTGFSTGGATKEDVALFAEHVKKPLLIKAAGGISGPEDAQDFLILGASRLGTSRVVKSVKEMKNKENV